MKKYNNENKANNLYDDGNIPEIDLPKNSKSDEYYERSLETLHSSKDSSRKDAIK